MSGLDLLVWATRSLSFSNTIAFLWLGLTVLLNAERRVLGTWIAGGGLVFAGAFFAGHSALVGRDLGIFYGLAPAVDLELWWRIGWWLFISPPYMWYVVVAWYSGILGTRHHRIRLAAVSLLGMLAGAFLALAGPLPSYGQLIQGAPVAVPNVRGVPVVALVYPIYGALCIVLALDALRRPMASKRLMGDLARGRARPWLVAASGVLLVVSLSVGGAMAWLLHWTQTRETIVLSRPTLALFLGLDLGISGLLSIVAMLLGRAVVSYEIFTGKTLPRGGLFRHWRNSLLLAAGYGILLGGSLALPVDPVYRLLLATVLMTGFYALLSWRTFVEREQAIERLRPFVTSQRLSDRLLRPADALDVGGDAAFRALCDDVLGARVAFLAALGPLASLAGPGLACPKGVSLPPSELGSLAGPLARSHEMCLRVDPARFGGATWAVPLWSDCGPIGVLLLGDKRDGGLYVQEEIEVARAVGERLIDTQVSAELGRRLMALQRQRLAETQVLDQRARRVLHDDVLPRLHTALLTLDGAGKGVDQSARAVEMLMDVHRDISRLLRELPTSLAPEVERLGLIGALRHWVDGELHGAFDGVSWYAECQAERAARHIPGLVAEVVYCAAREAIRNAARHGRARDGERPLHLSITVSLRAHDGPGGPSAADETMVPPPAPGREAPAVVSGGDGLYILVEDDGVGLDGSDGSAGEGQGLALHSTMMAVIGGTLTVEGVPGSGTRVSLALPQSASLPK